MRFIVMWVLILGALQATAAAPCEKESVPWLENVDVKDGCEAGKEFRYQCKQCTCDDDGKTASCPKWVKCCKVGEYWSTNNCNLCFCDENFQRICKAISCSRRKSK